MSLDFASRTTQSFQATVIPRIRSCTRPVIWGNRRVVANSSRVCAPRSASELESASSVNPEVDSLLLPVGTCQQRPLPPKSQANTLPPWKTCSDSSSPNCESIIYLRHSALYPCAFVSLSFLSPSALSPNYAKAHTRTLISASAGSWNLTDESSNQEALSSRFKSPIRPWGSVLTCFFPPPQDLLTV